MPTKKTKSLYVEVNGFSYLVAGVTGLKAPLTIESIDEFSRQEPEMVREFLGMNAPGNRYFSGHVGIVPESRFFRLYALDSMTKAKESGYFEGLLEEQYRISSKTHRAAVISAESGAAFSAQKPLQAQKTLILCGAEARELDAFQDNLLQCGIYPESIQLTTLSALAGLKHYLRQMAIKEPVLCVEMTQNCAHLFVLNRDRVELVRPVGFGFNAVFPVIRDELGLKSENSAQDLFYSNTFDFRDIGTQLFKRLLKEINASCGFFEVQTGQTIAHLMMPLLPQKLIWIADVLSAEMEIAPLKVDYGLWAEKLRVSFGDGVSAMQLDSSHFGLMSLFVNTELDANGTEEKK